MKSSVLLGFGLSVNAGLVPLVERQLSGLFSGQGQALQAALTKELTPKFFPNAVRKQVIWGPLTLQAANGTHKSSGLDSGADAFTKGISPICKNCMMLKANYDLADKNGKRLDLKDGVYIHHIIMSDSTGRMGGGGVTPKCPAWGGGLGSLFGGGGGAAGATPGAPKGAGGLASFFGGGAAPAAPAAAPAAAPMGGHSHARRRAEEVAGRLQKRQGFGSILVVKGHEDEPILYAPPNNAFKSGNWFGDKPGMTANIEAINYRDFPQDVYLSIDAEYLQMEGNRPADYLNIGFGMMTTGGCGGGLNLNVPKDRAKTFTSNDYESRNDGYILNISPHLHDGAVDMQILVNGKVACKSLANYGEDGQAEVNGKKWETISSYTPCHDPIKVSKGDKVVLTSEYDLTKHSLRPRSAEKGMEAEAMAVAFYRFAS